MLVASGALCLVAARDAVAQKWPEKTVRIVTPFAPGGGTDIFARILAQRLTETLGQQFIVDNRPGAGSTLGTEFVARSPADGYTLLVTSASFSFNSGLYPKLRFDPVKDFAPVSMIVRVPHVVCVLPSLPVGNLQDFIKLARARPGEVLYATAGAGSAIHLAAALFGVVTNTQMTHVPYKGAPATTTALMSGEATVTFSTIESVLPLLRSKRLRPLAVSTRERTPALPDVPTVMEAGVRDYEAIGWFGLIAPAGTPAAVVNQLSGEVSRAMATPAIRDRALQDGAVPVGNSPAEFERFVHSEITRWTRIILQAGIRLE